MERCSSVRFYVNLSGFHNGSDDLESLWRADGEGRDLRPPPAHLLLVFPLCERRRGASDGIELAPEWQTRPVGGVEGRIVPAIDLKNVVGNTDTGAVATYRAPAPATRRACNRSSA